MVVETSEQVGAAERRRRCRPAGFLRASNTCFTCFAFLLHHSPHFVLLGQLGEEVLVLQDVRVGVEGGQGVEKEGGELGGQTSTEGSLLDIGHGETQGELGGGDVVSGNIAADVVAPGKNIYIYKLDLACITFICKKIIVASNSSSKPRSKK